MGVKYTPEAAGARIEGTVIVECVVLANGKVRDVRVVKSLDPVHGLDEEAIKAAKQWRFTPGKKGGVAVPTLVSIEFLFSLTRKEGATPFQPPSLFDSVPSTKNFTSDIMWVADPPPPGWPAIDRSAPGVSVRMLYPQGWMVSDDASPFGWFLLQNEDGTYLFLVSQLQPATWAQATGGGATKTELQQLKDSLQRRLSAIKSHARIETTGWMPFSRIWAWYEIRVPAGDSSMPQAIAANDPRRLERARWWRFIRNVGEREIAVDCFVVRRHGASNAEADEAVRQAGPLFLTMLRRLLITAQ